MNWEGGQNGVVSIVSVRRNGLRCHCEAAAHAQRAVQVLARQHENASRFIRWHASHDKHLAEIAVHELKHEEQSALLADQLLEVDDVRVLLQLLQRFQLAELQGLVPRAKFFLDFLHGHALAAGLVLRLEHTTEGALTKNFEHVVLLHGTRLKTLLMVSFNYCMFVYLHYVPK